MNNSEYDDPERSYRRGFQQGAYAVLEVVSPNLSSSLAKKLEDWVLKKLHRWRLKADVDEAERTRPITTKQAPPPPPDAFPGEGNTKT